MGFLCSWLEISFTFSPLTISNLMPKRLPLDCAKNFFIEFILGIKNMKTVICKD